jgi:hypothetical protein
MSAQKRKQPLGSHSSCKKRKTVDIVKIFRKHPVSSNLHLRVQVAWKNSANFRASDAFRKGNFSEGLRIINKHIKPRVAFTYFDFWNTLIQKEADNEMFMLSVDVNNTVFISIGPPSPLPSFFLK